MHSPNRLGSLPARRLAACKILSGRYKEASPAVVVLALLFAGKFAVQ